MKVFRSVHLSAGQAREPIDLAAPEEGMEITGWRVWRRSWLFDRPTAWEIVDAGTFRDSVPVVRTPGAPARPEPTDYWIEAELRGGSIPSSASPVWGDPALPPEQAEEDLPVSDHGVEGAVPLPPLGTEARALDGEVSDAHWAQQNRRINDLLAGGSR